MTASDWIALAQALLLVAAALLALRGYSLGLIEHREAREEAAKAPLRDLIGDVIREVKELAAQAEKRVMPGGTQRLDLIAGASAAPRGCARFRTSGRLQPLRNTRTNDVWSAGRDGAGHRKGPR